MAKVSVIIPAYNMSHYLPDAIQSVLGQSFKDYELIVVDDGSSDSTKEVVNEFKENVKYIYQDNRGLPGARNTGIKNAHGEYVAFLDADDYWMPELLEKAINILDGDDDIALVHARTQRIDEDGNYLVSPPREPSLLSGKIFIDLLVRKANISCPTVVVRKDVLKKTGIFDENLAYLGSEDRDLWLRIAKEYKVKFINEKLAFYRMRKNSMSKNAEKMRKAQYYVVEKQFKNKNIKWSVYRKALSAIHREAGHCCMAGMNKVEARKEYWKALTMYQANIRILYNLTKTFV